MASMPRQHNVTPGNPEMFMICTYPQYLWRWIMHVLACENRQRVFGGCAIHRLAVSNPSSPCHGRRGNQITSRQVLETRGTTFDSVTQKSRFIAGEQLKYASKQRLCHTPVGATYTFGNVSVACRQPWFIPMCATLNRITSMMLCCQPDFQRAPRRPAHVFVYIQTYQLGRHTHQSCVSHLRHKTRKAGSI